MLSQAPRAFVEARYRALVQEKRELQEKLRGMSARGPDHDANAPATHATSEHVCGVCLEDVDIPQYGKRGGRAAAVLGCGHAHHFDCMALLMASNGERELRCPRCRFVEPKFCDFETPAQPMTAAARRARGDDEVAEDEADASVRRRNLISELLQRAIGVQHADRENGDGAGAVLVPVPAVPVNSLDELQACSTGQKRAIFMPPPLPTAPVETIGKAANGDHDDLDDDDDDEILMRERAARIARMREAQRRKDEEAVHNGLQRIEDALEEAEERAARGEQPAHPLMPQQPDAAAAPAPSDPDGRRGLPSGVTWMRREML